ncbi:MAG: GNAT family N-acetyltransferase [Proteobacteria bacterium]|nr:GNAT family N-acetyltransferase [Pseudomonadota bacterium]
MHLLERENVGRPQIGDDHPRQGVELRRTIARVEVLDVEGGDGEPVGHAAAGPCGLPHPEVAASDGELKRLYVLKDHQNAGWGGRLFQTALDWLQRDGPCTLWIGVWSENLGAQRFYARHGFEHVGDYEFPVGRVRDHEFILRRRAEASPG